MRGQWGLILALIFAFIVAIFAVINVGTVTVDYLFGKAQWPLVLVILASALFGALIVGGFGSFRVIRMHRQNRYLEKRNEVLAGELQKFEGSLNELTTKSQKTDKRNETGEVGEVKGKTDGKQSKGQKKTGENQSTKV